MVSHHEEIFLLIPRSLLRGAFIIAGNAYRLITVIHFNTGRVYVRRVLTHAAYTRGTWQDD